MFYEHFQNHKLKAFLLSSPFLAIVFRKAGLDPERLSFLSKQLLTLGQIKLHRFAQIGYQRHI